MSYGSSPNDPHEVYQYPYMTPQNNYAHSYLTDGASVAPNEESNFWSNSPRTNSPSPNAQSPIVGPYQIYTPISYAQNDHRTTQYTTEYDFSRGTVAPFVRIVKRRTTANKKERRRTQSINNAYADLRDCIPNVPADTKLSKIKTLRLATLYISYLTGVLETDDPAGGFKAELGSLGRKSAGNHIQVNECTTGQISPKSDVSEELNGSGGGIARRAKGRTGWPQHVWALELKQEQTL
ncbi:PREDICTED: heart- and neural crest derivatives-expressed protein 2-like [Nicrophorus vespilloides]|uniref:Heart- and neural crest derivatives-expressed protein 2-like n=1 Tax=Nicrophorus vespilloides TaxID=110193 RepID=A0ABM1NGX0_NICVS|nr:PREDICTED: heart- and neural crest derivatives-expressed protein 2-like [Nicrophorus vespilloides]